MLDQRRFPAPRGESDLDRLAPIGAWVERIHQGRGDQLWRITAWQGSERTAISLTWSRYLMQTVTVFGTADELIIDWRGNA